MIDTLGDSNGPLEASPGDGPSAPSPRKHRRRVRSLARISRPLAGAKGDSIVDGRDLAVEAFGERAFEGGSGLTAFAYLYRRFGPPRQECDPYKDLAAYILTTQDPDVYLWLTPSASAVAFAVGYLADPSARDSAEAPWRLWHERRLAWWLEQHPDATEGDYEAWAWAEKSAEERAAVEAIIGPYPKRTPPGRWREGSAVQRRVNEALLGTLKSLLRPVCVRDVEINLFGRMC